MTYNRADLPLSPPTRAGTRDRMKHDRVKRGVWV